eukprot:scaffold88030_cov30-Tisochrysis_lutea.AAC.1
MRRRSLATPLAALLACSLAPACALRRSAMPGLHHTVCSTPRSSNYRCALAEERIESAKAGGVSLLAGSLSSVPLALVSPQAFGAQWELAHDGLAVMLLLFGVVYRYAVREDDNDMLKQGVVGAFAVTRALAELRASPECTALPLSCGSPLGYADWQMIANGAFGVLEALVAFGGAAFVLEMGFRKGVLRRLPGSLPTE